MPSSPLIADERAYVHDLITRIVDECPHRRPTSEDERRAQAIVAEEMEALGLSTHLEGFSFNNSIYAHTVLHFGVGTLGSAVSGVSPLLGLALHLSAGLSYALDSNRNAYTLRRLLGFRHSQNMLAVRPAKKLVDGKPRLRIVIAAHADAALTGLIFRPDVVRQLAGKGLPPPLDRPIGAATYAQFALAGCDLARLLLGKRAKALRPLELLLSVPPFLSALAALDVVLRDELVPGANDDLSGVAALPILASRFAADQPEDVEMVFIATGCEEAGMGGADALAREHLQDWDRERTVFLALDGLTGGDLYYLKQEGEVIPHPVPAWLVEAVEHVQAGDARFSTMKGYVAPVGGSDAQPFLAHGYEAIALVCVDPSLGTPRNYHLPTDTPENLEMDQLMASIDFAEKLVRQIFVMRGVQ